MLEDSFAIYASHKCDVHIHINIWTDLKYNNYIDLGFLVTKKRDFKTISVYIPYHFVDKEMQDLSEVLKTSQVMTAIFNQPCDITSSNIKLSYDVQFQNLIVKFLPLESCLYKVEKVADGTLLTFHISQWSKDNACYFRFRLPYKSLSDHLQAQKHTYLHSIESPIMNEEYIYNFKLNESRTLPEEILQNINDHATLTKINFFICVPQKCDVKNDKVYKIRIVEQNKFKTYMPQEFTKKSLVTYEWKQDKKSIKATFSAFLKRKCINFQSILLYMLIIITINTVCNLFFYYISKRLGL